MVAPTPPLPDELDDELELDELEELLEELEELLDDELLEEELLEEELLELDELLDEELEELPVPPQATRAPMVKHKTLCLSSVSGWIPERAIFM